MTESMKSPLLGAELMEAVYAAIVDLVDEPDLIAVAILAGSPARGLGLSMWSLEDDDEATLDLFALALLAEKR